MDFPAYLVDGTGDAVKHRCQQVWQKTAGVAAALALGPTSRGLIGDPPMVCIAVIPDDDVGIQRDGLLLDLRTALATPHIELLILPGDDATAHRIHQSRVIFSRDDTVKTEACLAIMLRGWDRSDLGLEANLRIESIDEARRYRRDTVGWRPRDDEFLSARRSVICDAATSLEYIVNLESGDDDPMAIRTAAQKYWLALGSQAVRESIAYVAAHLDLYLTTSASDTCQYLADAGHLPRDLLPMCLRWLEFRPRYEYLLVTDSRSSLRYDLADSVSGLKAIARWLWAYIAPRNQEGSGPGPGPTNLLPGPISPSGSGEPATDQPRAPGRRRRPT